MEQEAMWQNYEEVARHLLDRMCGQFGLDRVEGKQTVDGDSGTSWEIDAKGVKQGGIGFVVVECKRYPMRKVPQSVIAGLAWSIRDVGADGGIVVTPIGLQEGARKVAEHAGIVEVRLDPGSTTEQYVLSFLQQTFLGLSEHVSMTEKLEIRVVHADGSSDDD